MNVRKLRRKDIEWADIVFVSAMLVQRDSLLRVVAMSKANGKRVAVGGPYVSTNSEHLDADHIFIGEAEETLPEFVRDLERGNARHVYNATQRPPYPPHRRRISN